MWNEEMCRRNEEEATMKEISTEEEKKALSMKKYNGVREREASLNLSRSIMSLIMRNNESILREAVYKYMKYL